MLRTSSYLRPWHFLILFLTISTLALAQGTSTNPITNKQEDADQPLAREQWFRDGRIIPGVNSAVMLQKAYATKMAERSARAAAQQQLMSNQESGATVIVGGPSTTWTPMGPAPILQDSYQSQDYGPVTGRATAVAIDPADSSGNTVLIGGAYGGVWKSTNAAATDPTTVTWTPLLDNQATLAVGAIVYKPDNDHVILVGTGEAKNAVDSYYGLGILRSTDGGTTWTLIQTANSGAINFGGVGFARMAFSTDNTNVVVAATASTPLGRNTGLFTSTSVSGLFYSTDAGATWNTVTMTDPGGATTSAAAASSVIYNPQEHKFFAAVRFHGIYSSSDGINWTKTTGSMTNGTVTIDQTSCPAVANPNTCSFYRAELAVRPDRDEMYAWVVNPFATQGETDPHNNIGIFKSTDGGATWTALTMTGINNCGTDISGCGAAQGYYNLTILAVPNPSNSQFTDLYAGAVNIFKCTMDPSTPANATCGGAAEPYEWMNVTHVYGCTPTGELSMVHPDQHHMAYVPGHPNIIYFMNDGGAYRTLNSNLINTGVCPANIATPPLLPFDDLNTHMGSMTQFVWATPHPTDPTAVIGGSQDNGTSATGASVPGATGVGWMPIHGGDGGYNWVRPDSTSDWIVSTTGVNIYKCTGGFSCNRGTWTKWVSQADVGNDDSAFYTPYMLDPQDSTKMIVGTCRVWRGGTVSTWGGAAISQLFTSSGDTTCNSDNDPEIYALAMGGPKVSTGSQVIWAGLDNGKIYMTLNADAATPTWTNVTPPSNLNPGTAPGGFAFRISSIALDPSDLTGKTAYATVMGFKVNHVLKTTDGGASWTGIAPVGVASGLPDAPADSVVLDPDDPTVVYVGTDVGVFVTHDNGATWAEVGPTTPTPGGVGFLPNAVVTHVAISEAGGKRLLIAGTYGRGVWKADLTPSGPLAGLSATALTFSTQLTNTTSAAQAVTLKNDGTSSLTVTGVSFTGAQASAFAQTNTCAALPFTLTVGSSCTYSVTFAPTTAGTFTAGLQFTDNAADSPQTVNLTGTAVTSFITASPTSVNFGNVVQGTTSGLQEVVLSNSGSNAVTISGISITGTNTADFAQTNGCSGSVVAGGSCVIRLTFTPSTTSTESATLTVTYGGGSAASVVSLAGTGTTPAPNTSVSPHQLGFTSQAIGLTSAPQNIAITNNGTADLNVSALTLSGTNSTQFALTTGTCGATPFTLTPTQICTVGVTFTPNAAGDFSATFTVTDNAPTGYHTASLSGTGATPASLSASPTSLSFSTPLTTPLAKQVTITNTGGVSTFMGTIDFTGTNASLFTQTSNCSLVLGAGASCTVTVLFTPTAVISNASATLTVNSTASSYTPASSTSVALTGTATNAATVSPTSLTFSGTLVGVTSSSQAVTLTNNASAAITISGISSDNPVFTQTNTCGTSVAANGTCTINVSFKPTATGSATGTLTVNTNAGNPTVALSGTGEDYSAPTVDSSNTSKTVTAGSSATYNFTVAPVGSSTSGTISFACSGLPSLASCSFSPASVANISSSQAVTMTITTTAPGANAAAGGSTLLMMWLVLPGMALMIPSKDKRGRRAKVLVMLMLAVGIATVLAMAACGGGGGSSTPPPSPGTPKGTYTVTISATSGSVTHSTNVTLVVQ